MTEELPTNAGPSKRKVLAVAGSCVLGVLTAVAWAWDATHHDDHGMHGAPLTVEEIEYELAGSGFTDEYDSILMVRRASCRPGENGNGAQPAVHFRCELKFDYESDRVVVHVLPDEFLFKSDS